MKLVRGALPLVAVVGSTLVFVRPAAAGAHPFTVVRDVTYVERETGPLLLDAYLPESEEPVPAVLVVHGGAWRSGNKGQLRRYAEELARRGLACFAINYRLAPASKYPAQIEDCRSALAYVRRFAAQYNVDPTRIGAIGYSAGGHLVALLGTTGTAGAVVDGRRVDTRLQAVVAGGAPCDFQEIPADAEWFLDWLGGTRAEKPEVYRDASPRAFVSADDPPMLFFNGLSDRLVPIEWTRPTVQALEEAGVPVRAVELPRNGHIAAAMNRNATGPAFDFLVKQLGRETVAIGEVAGESPDIEAGMVPTGGEGQGR